MVGISFDLTSSHMLLVGYVIETGTGPSLLQQDLVEPR